MDAHKVEQALTDAVKKKRDFYQFSGVIDLISKKYIQDEEKRGEFLKELADRLRGHKI